MKPLLDATAGNRMIWGKNKFQDINKVVFLDKETRLVIPPDIFADFRKLPFRDKCFSCVIFDPPYAARGKNPPPWYNDPTNKGKWYGFVEKKSQVINLLHKGQEEFQRVTDRLCFQWWDNYPRDMSLEQALMFFREWEEQQRIQRIHSSKKNRKSKTWWITFTLS